MSPFGSFRRPVTAIIFLVVALIFASCSANDDGVATTDEESDAAPANDVVDEKEAAEGESHDEPSGDDTEDSDALDEAESSDDDSDDDAENGDENADSDDDSGDEGPGAASSYRVAPEGSTMALLRWDQTSARKVGHDGTETVVADGPFTEVADVFSWGVVYQRPGDATIWRQNGDEVVAVVTPGANENHNLGDTITLEGVIIRDGEVPFVFYTHTESGQVESAVELRAHDLTTGFDNPIEIVGGVETATSFSAISGRSAVSVSSGEGFHWMNVYDLIDKTSEERYFCQPGNCTVFYDAATIRQDVIYGMALRSDGGGQPEGYALDSRQPGSGLLNELHRFDYAPDLYEIDDMFAVGSRIVISLRTPDGAPLPAAVVDTNSGEVWTLPDAEFVRPLFLT